VGERLGVSQQAADRYLMSLAGAGLITRTYGGRKQRLTLAAPGAAILRKEYHDLRRIFEGPSKLSIRGAVASGLGEGRYYLSQPGYVVQFAERLGYSPYPGTLNVKLSGPELLRISAVKDWRGVRIDGFSASGRTFGGATCHAARLRGRPGHLITPDRTHHTDVVEFIAPEFLREALQLKDGDTVDIELEET
jgi:riboflavin kinase